MNNTRRFLTRRDPHRPFSPRAQHLEHQILMFCKMHYASEFREGEVCRSAAGALEDQGSASRWIKEEQEKMMKAAGRPI